MFSLVPLSFAVSCICGSKVACGAYCDIGSDCCSNSCDTSTKKCIDCLPIGASCAGTMGVCCDGLTCSPGGKCIDATQITAPGSWSNGIYVWSALAVLIACSFLGLAYMAAKLFELAVLDAWVKIELGELVNGMVIAGFCISLLAITDNAAQFLSGSPNVISAAHGFMQTLYSDGHTLYKQLAVAYFNIAKTASYSYTTGTSIMGLATVSLSASPASGMSPLVSEVGQALDAVANFMLLAAAQAAFLQFFNTAVVVMLPVAIFLRSFSFTRRMGATLLAAVITVSVIYPSSLLISQEVYGTFASSLKTEFAKIEVTPVENPPTTDIVCNPLMQMFVQSPLPFLGGEIGWWVVVCLPTCTAAAILSFGSGFGTCMKTCYDVISTTFMIIKAIFPIILNAVVFQHTIDKLQPGNLIEGYYEPLQQYALPAVAKFSVLSIVAFLIPIIISLSLLRNLAAAFGGETQLYGLSKLV